MFQCHECLSLFETPAYGERHEFGVGKGCIFCGRAPSALPEAAAEEWCQHYACPHCGGAEFRALSDESYGT